MLCNAPNLNRAICWSAVNAPPEMRAGDTPTHSREIAISVIAHPIQVIDLEGKIGKSGQDGKKECLELVPAIKTTAV